MAASLPSLRVMLVCSTMVVRPVCSGVQTARAVSPLGIGAKKLVLLSMVAVRCLSASAGARGHAAHDVGQRHDRAAVHDAAPVAQLLAHDHLGFAASAARARTLTPMSLMNGEPVQVAMAILDIC